MTRIQFPCKRSALTLLTPYHYPEHLRHLPKQPHPNHPMKRFKKKTLNQPHKNLNNTIPPKQKAPQTTRTSKLPSRRLRSMPLQTPTSKILVNENTRNHSLPHTQKPPAPKPSPNNYTYTRTNTPSSPPQKPPHTSNPTVRHDTPPAPR